MACFFVHHCLQYVYSGMHVDRLPVVADDVLEHQCSLIASPRVIVNSF